MRIASVECRFEDAYSVIETPAARRRQLEQAYIRHFAREAGDSEQRLAELSERSDVLASGRAKLLDLDYSDCIPREMLVEEQKNLLQELARVDEEQTRLGEDEPSAERRASELSDLLGDARARYLAAALGARN